MGNQRSLFSTALRWDLLQRDMTVGDLARRIGLTQQAVDKWLARGFPPPKRYEELVAVLGPNSAVAKLTHAELYASKTQHGVESVSRLRTLPEVVDVLPKSIAAAPALQAPPPPVDAAPALPAPVAGDKGYYTQSNTEFVTALPPGLRDNAERPCWVERGGSVYNLRLDYASPTLLLEVGPPVKTGHWSAGISSRAMRLLAARMLSNRSPRIVLAFVGAAHIARRAAGVSDEELLAEMLGVETWCCATGVELALRVASVEGVPREHQSGTP